MKMLTVEEATPGLGRLVELAAAGEQIQICKRNGIVELRPAYASQNVKDSESACEVDGWPDACRNAAYCFRTQFACYARVFGVNLLTP